MARQINGQYVKRADLPYIPPTEIYVDHDLNTRLYKPNVSDLVQSFNEEGQKQPCVGRPLPDGRVQLVAGYRRWLAAMEIWKQQEKEGVPPENRFKLAITIQKMSPEEALDVNIVENFSRKSLSPVEIAHAIDRMRFIHGWVDAEGTQKIARKFGKSPAWVTECEQLSTLKEDEKFAVHRFYETNGEEGISQTVAKILAKIPEDRREKALDEARRASMKGKANVPSDANGTPSTPASTSGASKSKTSTRENAKISSRAMADAAEKNGAVRTPNRTLKDWLEFLDGYDQESDAHPLHPLTKKLIKRLRGFVTRDFSENQCDNVFLEIDAVLNACYDKYCESVKKRGGKSGD